MNTKKLKSRQTLCFTVSFFSLFKTILVFRLLWKIPNENETVIAIGGRPTTMLLHALCVFLCTPLYEPKWELLEVNLC